MRIIEHNEVGIIESIDKQEHMIKIKVHYLKKNITLITEGEFLITKNGNELFDLSFIKDKNMSRISICDNSSLVGEIEGGIKLVFPASQDYESWQYYSSNGSKIICTPGGEIAEWDELTQ